MRAPPPNTVTHSLLLRGWPAMRNNSPPQWVARPWTNRLRKTAVRISHSSTARPGWLSSPAEFRRRIREAMPGGGRGGGRKRERTLVDYLLELHQVLLQKKTEIIFKFRTPFTRPLSWRGVRLNCLAGADGSVWLLLRQQHALIHSPCEVVHMAAIASRRHTQIHMKQGESLGKLVQVRWHLKKKPTRTS